MITQRNTGIQSCYEHYSALSGYIPWSAFRKSCQGIKILLKNLFHLQEKQNIPDETASTTVAYLLSCAKHKLPCDRALAVYWNPQKLITPREILPRDGSSPPSGQTVGLDFHKQGTLSTCRELDPWLGSGLFQKAELSNSAELSEECHIFPIPIIGVWLSPPSLNQHTQIPFINEISKQVTRIKLRE